MGGWQPRVGAAGRAGPRRRSRGGGGRGLLPGSPTSSKNGGRQTQGAGRAGATESVLPLASGGPRAVHSALIPQVADARHWRRRARAPSGGGAATQRPRFPPRWCACAQPGGPRQRAPPSEAPLPSPRLAPLLPPLSGPSRPVSKAVSTAASRGRSGPESAAAPLACGKCHQMAG